jgi:nitronate monooxygenase
VRSDLVAEARVLESDGVAIRTSFTELLDLVFPIALGPMAVVAGGELASAVSNAGGLGLVGGGYGDPAWLERELAIVSNRARGKWGVGLITWKATRETVELALSYRPDVFFLSFGDPAPLLPLIIGAGCLPICQVQDVDAASEAVALGAQVIVAQGAEAGGHGALRATLPLVPAVVDAVAPTPVLAAGGIGDGRGIAAALALGADGVVVGTRFCAASEALMQPLAKQRLLAAHGGETTRTRVFDTVRGLDWPAPYTGRALRNHFVDRWHDSDAALAGDSTERERYRSAVEGADFDTAVIWAGECVDLLDRVEPAATIVERMGTEAETWLLRAPGLVT